MSASEGSTKVIVIALFANLGIAISKFLGFLFSGSSSLLAESIHSFVDSTNQVLLLLGNKASKKPPDKNHPLGYGREIYFWSFVVTILLFSLGGLFAIYEGIHKISETEPLENPKLALIILGASILMEGYSFYACLKEVQAINRFESLWVWFKKTTASGLLVIFTEDAGALIGLFIAAACVSLSWATGNPAWDAYGSIMIGSLLVILAILLAVEIKSFIIGEAPSKNYLPEIEIILKEQIPNAKVLKFLALQMGDSEVLISMKVSPGGIQNAEKLIKSVNHLETLIKKRFPEIKWQFVEPDISA